MAHTGVRFFFFFFSSFRLRLLLFLAAVLAIDRCIGAALAMAASPRVEAVIALRVRLSSGVVKVTDVARFRSTDGDGDAFFAKMAKTEYWVRKVLTDKVDADAEEERKCLGHSKILETLMALRDEEVERIRQDAQSKAEAANQVDVDVEIPKG